VVNTAYNMLGEIEECTRTEPPMFAGDEAYLDLSDPAVIVTIDTVDVDGDDERCRVRFDDSPTGTAIVSIGELRPARDSEFGFYLPR
jgi:hypothetical protein